MILRDLLPTLNAFLNGLSVCFLIAGYFFIRRRQITAHQYCMAAAFACSIVFLGSYLYYHYHFGSVPFTGQGPVRVFYFAVLISHIIFAAVIVPLALRVLYLAWRRHFSLHARLARWTLPLWLYVCVTGIMVYWMLYRMRW